MKGIARAFEERYPESYRSTFIHSKWEDFNPERYGITQFDIVFCSHTIYHLDPKEFLIQFNRMVNLLKPNGRLFIVARRSGDDAYRFMLTYYEAATGKNFNEITIETAYYPLDVISRRYGLRLQQELSEAWVDLPFRTNPADAQTIVGFFLRRSWAKIPVDVRESIMVNYGQQDARLNQTDGIIVLHNR